jgi:hypothetical protein
LSSGLACFLGAELKAALAVLNIKYNFKTIKELVIQIVKIKRPNSSRKIRQVRMPIGITTVCGGKRIEHTTKRSKARTDSAHFSAVTFQRLV